MGYFDNERENSGAKIQEDLGVIVSKLITSKSSDMLSGLASLDDEDTMVGVMAVLKLVKDFGKYTNETSEDLIELRKEMKELSKSISDLDRKLDKIHEELSDIDRRVTKMAAGSGKKAVVES